MYGPHNRARLPILLVVSSWTEKMDYWLSSFAPENLVSQDGFGGLISRQLAHFHNSRLNLVLAYGTPPEFRGGVHSLSVHIIYYECGSAYMYSSTYHVR